MSLAFSNGPLIAHNRCRGYDTVMIVAAGLAFLVVICLLLSMVQSPPAIGR